MGQTIQIGKLKVLDQAQNRVKMVPSKVLAARQSSPLGSIRGKVKLRHLSKKEMMEVLVNNPKLATQLEHQHHSYSGQQTTKQARALRKRLRRIGIYLSKLGHYGYKHD